MEEVYRRVDDGTDPGVKREGQEGFKRCTDDYLRNLRRIKWEEEMDWDIEDDERMMDSTEVLPEDLQDYTVPMIIVGSDVVRLYLT